MARESAKERIRVTIRSSVCTMEHTVHNGAQDVNRFPLSFSKKIVQYGEKDT